VQAAVSTEALAPQLPSPSFFCSEGEGREEKRERVMSRPARREPPSPRRASGTPRFGNGKGKGTAPTLASRPFTTRPAARGPGREGTRERAVSRARCSPSPLASPQLFFRAFFSGDKRDVSGDGRRESEGKRDRGTSKQHWSFVGTQAGGPQGRG